MGDALPADAGSVPASASVHSTVFVEGFRIGGSVVTSETEEVIVRGDLQASEAVGDPTEETAAAGMDFSTAIVVAQDDEDRRAADTTMP